MEQHIERTIAGPTVHRPVRSVVKSYCAAITVGSDLKPWMSGYISALGVEGANRVNIFISRCCPPMCCRAGWLRLSHQVSLRLSLEPIWNAV